MVRGGVTLRLTLRGLLTQADIVTVHVPLKADTRHLIDAAAFALMKRGVFFINTSRGPVVDEPALVAALQSGRVAGAGIDVYEQEPLPADAPIRKAEHVVLLPHKAAYSEESRLAQQQEVCDTVGNWIRDSWTPNVVNPGVRAILRPRRAIG